MPIGKQNHEKKMKKKRINGHKCIVIQNTTRLENKTRHYDEKGKQKKSKGSSIFMVGTSLSEGKKCRHD